MLKKLFYIIENIKKYRKCPALPRVQCDSHAAWQDMYMQEASNLPFNATKPFLRKRPIACVCVCVCVCVGGGRTDGEGGVGAGRGH